MDKKKIVVIGAGYAGLCLSYLLQDEYDVTLLEAHEEVGGRVRSVNKDGNVLEHGAEFIGNCHTTLLKFIGEFEISLTIIPKNCEEEQLKDRELRKVYLFIEEKARSVNWNDTPWKQEKFDKLSLGQVLDKWQEKGKINKIFRAHIDNFFENDYLSNIYEQNWLGLLCQVKGGLEAMKFYSEVNDRFFDNLENFRCEEGNQKLANEFLKRIKTKVNVKLNTIVQEITFDKEQVWIKTNDKIFQSDIVVLCISPNHFKKINFVPAWDNMDDFIPGMGHCMKTFHLPNGDGREDFFNNDFGEIYKPSRFSNQYIAYSGGDKLVNNLKIHEKKKFTEGLKKLGFKKDCSFSKLTDNENIHIGFSFGEKGRFIKVQKNLNSTLYDKKLYFAGEACSPDFFGFMEGALKSAERTKIKIDKNLKKNANQK